VLSREDNRIAARALLWAAVAIDPQNFVAHRRLAAALLNAEDIDAAAEEYARYIELLLKENDVRRAAGELTYARAFLGDMPQLRAAAAHLVPLDDIAKSLVSAAPAQSPAPLALADYAATRASSQYTNGRPHTAPPAVAKAAAAQAGLRRQRRPWFKPGAYSVAVSGATSSFKVRASQIEIGEYVLAVSLAAAATVLVVMVIGGLR
jgi:hypothetical protein